MFRIFPLTAILLSGLEAISQPADSGHIRTSPFVNRVGRESGLNKAETGELQELFIQYARQLKAYHRQAPQDSFRIHANRLRNEFLLHVRARFGNRAFRVIIRLMMARDYFPPVIRKEIGFRRKRMPR